MMNDTAAESLLRELLSSGASFYRGAIEGDSSVSLDFDDWERRARTAIAPAVPRAGIVEFTVHGEAASIKNSRSLVPTPGGKMRSIKGDKAQDFETLFLLRVPKHVRVRLAGPVRIEMVVHYASDRPDLDEALVLDCLQDRWAKDPITKKRYLKQAGVIQNDRQVKWKDIRHHLNVERPRVDIRVIPLAADPPLLEGFPDIVEQQRREKAFRDAENARLAGLPASTTICDGPLPF